MSTPETVQVSKFTKYSCIPGMLTFGTATVVIQKIILSTNSVTHEGVKQKFSKPWFQTEAMFVGMMLCLVVYEIGECLKRFKKVYIYNIYRLKKILLKLHVEKEIMFMF